ncbi:Uncharacterised protein [Bordetella pertussis]|nr:Uncharacterised protein [Bordetella pertussis]
MKCRLIRSPCALGRMPRRSRSNSGTPNMLSSSWISLVAAGCVMLEASAALRNECSSQRLRKSSRCFIRSRDLNTAGTEPPASRCCAMAFSTG